MNQQTKPPQQQPAPGTEANMTPRPQSEKANYKAAGKFEGKVVLLTGADSGIGKATAIAFAKEGADVAVVYLSEDQDANETKDKIEEEGRTCLLIKGDVGDKRFCKEAVEKTVKEFGKQDVLINNAGEQHPQQSIKDISEEQLVKTFRTNIFAMFFMSQAAMPHLQKGSSIINTASVTAYKGQPQLLDYSSTKGAIVSFTRSLSMNLAQKDVLCQEVITLGLWKSFCSNSQG